MNRFLMSTAAVLLLASPALAQPIGKASVAPEVQQRAQEQLQRQQSPQGDTGRGDRRGDRGPGDRGQQVAPPQQQQATPQDRGRQGRDDRRDGNRDGNRDFRRDQDRGRDFGRDYNRDGRTDYRRPGYGPRRDYSGFRDYHRGYNSSRRFRGPEYRRPAGWYDRRWSFGDILPGLFWSSSYWLNDFNMYDLPPPPYGTVWVRNGSDALLIDRDSGEIISVRYGVFY
jgi:Ni/Co efflux regulator RcnB